MAGKVISTAVPERNRELAFKAISQYVNRWKEAFVEYYDHEAYMKKGNNWGVMLIVGDGK
jgi:hypothetical protein